MKSLQIGNSLRALQVIPNVGPSIAADLVRLGIDSPGDLVGCDPDDLYDELSVLDGKRHDPCVRDVFEAAIVYAETGDNVPWWHFSRQRKARDCS
jgi:hypothetical protein